MRVSLIALGVAALASVAGTGAVPTDEPALVAAVEPESPVYVAGSQYSAVLHQRDRSWTLISLDGADVRVAHPDARCALDAPVPRGVWLVARDPAGGLELRALSATRLPTDHRGRVALRACGEDAAEGPLLRAPQSLIEWLGGTAGAVYVDG